MWPSSLASFIVVFGTNWPQHAITVSFGLEAHIMGMTKACFDEIVSTSITGSNVDRGDRQHSFLVPRRFNEESSSNPDKPRTVNIFLAWVSQSWVWALVDFSRLVRFQVVSRDKHWSLDDMIPASTVIHRTYFIALLSDALSVLADSLGSIRHWT